MFEPPHRLTSCFGGWRDVDVLLVGIASLDSLWACARRTLFLLKNCPQKTQEQHIVVLLLAEESIAIAHLRQDIVGSKLTCIGLPGFSSTPQPDSSKHKRVACALSLLVAEAETSQEGRARGMAERCQAQTGAGPLKLAWCGYSGPY